MFQEVQFKDCKMLGLRFDEVNTFRFSINCIRSQFDHASFYGLSLQKSSFNECNFLGADFSDVNASRSQLINSVFIDAVFDGTNLEDCDLTGSTDFYIDPSKNRIKGAIIPRHSLEGLLHQHKLTIVD